jgi:hypothetical protein
VQAIPAEYYKRVYDTILNKAGGVRHFLENRKLSSAFDPDGHAPVTEYLLQMLGASASPLAAAIREALEDGDHPLVQPDLVSLKSLHSLLETQRGIGFFSDQGLSAVLREMGFVSNARIRLGNDKTSQTRHTLWTHLTRFKGDAQDAARSRLNGSTLDERGAVVEI